MWTFLFLSMKHLLFYTCKVNNMSLLCLGYLLFHHVDVFLQLAKDYHVDISITCLYLSLGFLLFHHVDISITCLCHMFGVLTFPRTTMQMFPLHAFIICLGDLLFHHVDIFLQLAEDYPVSILLKSCHDSLHTVQHHGDFLSTIRNIIQKVQFR